MFSWSVLIKCWLLFLLTTFTLEMGQDPKNPITQFVPSVLEMGQWVNVKKIPKMFI